VAEIIWHNEKRAIRELIPYEANPRQITDKQAKDLKASLAKFGIADPIIINTDNMIIGGHQRKKILETLLGYDPDFQIDVRVPDRELSIDEARELNVRLNKNTGSWDFDVLANEFELDDLLDWGFDKKELDLDLWADDAPEDVEPQIDKAEELRVKWGVESGQLWQLGEHRLICGDCTDKAVVERVMQREVADIVFTSPPYGSKSGNLSGVPFYGQDSKDTFQDHTGFLCDFMKLCRVNDDSAVLVNLSYNDNNRTGLFEFAVSKEHGFNLYETFVWKKIRSMPLKGDNISRLCEFVFLFSRGRYKIPTRSRINEGLFNFYESSKEFKQGHGNLAAFPVDLPEHFLSIFSLENDCVYEPFLGTGTTLIACERLGRKCRAVEISPAYVAVAIQRWVDVTGKEPVLLSN